MLVLCGLLFPTGSAFAGWVSIKNETDRPVVVQESWVVNNQVRHGKQVRLMPGETLREYQTLPGSKTIRVHDCGSQKRTLCDGAISWDKNGQKFTVREEGQTFRVDSTTTSLGALTKAETANGK